MLLDMKKAQREWSQAMKWLDGEAARGRRDGNRLIEETVEEVQEQIKVLPYDQKMKYLRGHTSTGHLARFLGKRWLTDDHLNIMMHVLSDLNKRSKSVSARSSLIAPLAFSNEILLVDSKMKLGQEKWEKTTLHRYETQIKQEKIELLLFTVHINENHWIAGQVDFVHKTVSYGPLLYPPHLIPLGTFPRNLPADFDDGSGVPSTASLPARGTR